MNTLLKSIVLLAFTFFNCLYGFKSYSLKPQQSKRSTHQYYVSAIMPPADLTPAVDKFPTLPTTMKPFLDQTLPSVTSRGPAPGGPEPFEYVSKEVQPISEYVKEMIKSENPVLTMAASHFFEQVCRLLLVLLL